MPVTCPPDVSLPKSQVKKSPRKVPPNPIPLIHKTRLITHTVALVFQVAPEQIRSPRRENARIAFARQVAMYLTHICCGLNYAETGRLFRRDRTTVAHACALVEDRRDDLALDQTLNHTEAAISCLLSTTANMENISQ